MCMCDIDWNKAHSRAQTTGRYGQCPGKKLQECPWDKFPSGGSWQNHYAEPCTNSCDLLGMADCKQSMTAMPMLFMQLLPTAHCQNWRWTADLCWRRVRLAAPFLGTSALSRALEQSPGERSTEAASLAPWTSSCALRWQDWVMQTLGEHLSAFAMSLCLEDRVGVYMSCQGSQTG